MNRSSVAQVGRNTVRFAIRLYQLLVSPLLGFNCRFIPSCSQYALDALDSHGTMHGSILAVRRLLRCHPWHPGGHDPVPCSCATGYRQSPSNPSISDRSAF